MEKEKAERKEIAAIYSDIDEIINFLDDNYFDDTSLAMQSCTYKLQLLFERRYYPQVHRRKKWQK